MLCAGVCVPASTGSGTLDALRLYDIHTDGRRQARVGELPSIPRSHWADAANIGDASLESAHEELQLQPLAPPWLQFLHCKFASSKPAASLGPLTN